MQNAKVQSLKRLNEKGPIVGNFVRGTGARQRWRGLSAPLTFAFCLLPSAFCLSSALADIQLPPKSSSRGERELRRNDTLPPTPVATQVRLQPGGRVEIILQANGTVDKPIRFLLRTPPAHGAFEGLPRRVSRNSVVVTYVHRAADGPGHDAFTFAAQAPGTAVSAAETVDIEVAAPAPDAAPAPAGAPDLVARPSELDFGAVTDGKSTGVTLTVENRGSSPASGQLDPPAPWLVDGDPSYHLDHGGRQTFRLVFLPHAEGAFAETLHIDAGDGNSTSGCIVRLVGTGLRATAHPPPTVPAPAAAPDAAPAAVAAATAPPPPSPPDFPKADPTGPGTVHAAPQSVESGPVLTNEARVTEVKVAAVGPSTVDLTWRPPAPLPRSYRVERRSFARDERAEGGVRIDWLPYERVSFRVRSDQVTATVRGLAAGEPATLRVVTVDAAGRLSQPSPLVNAFTVPGAGWWHPTPLKVLSLLLAGCLGLLVRRRRQERRRQAELDARHVRDEPLRESSEVENAGPFHPS